MKYINYLILVIFIAFFSCKKENDKDSLPQGTFLTINGDTREIIHNGDSELRIDKEILLNPQWYNFKKNFKVVQLFIHDPNNSLIANFGELNYDNNLIIRFYLNENIVAGEYTTIESNNIQINQYESFCTFNGYIAKEDQNFKISEELNKWIIEFKNFEYVSNNITVFIGGRIILIKE